MWERIGEDGRGSESVGEDRRVLRVLGECRRGGWEGRNKGEEVKWGKGRRERWWGMMEDVERCGRVLGECGEVRRSEESGGWVWGRAKEGK